MKTANNDDQLDALLRDAARDARPGEWVRAAGRGLEARVLKRIAKPESWTEAIFSLTSWRPLAAAVGAVLIVGAWSGRGAADVFNEDWLTTQALEEPDDGLAGSGFDDLEF